MTREGIFRMVAEAIRRIPSCLGTSRTSRLLSSFLYEICTFCKFHIYLVLAGLTYKNVMIIPLFSGEGPPARIVMFHPVWSMSDVPNVARVRGSFSIALFITEVSQLALRSLAKDTHVLNSIFLVCSSPIAAGVPSRRFLRYSSHSAFISAVSLAYLSCMNSTMIWNRPFGSFSSGCSAVHSSRYVAHFSSINGFHFFVYVKAWYACQGWSILAFDLTFKMPWAPLQDEAVLLLLWNQPRTRYINLSQDAILL